MSNTFKGSVLTLIALLLSGCVSGYKSFYTAVDGATPESINAIRAAPAPLTPMLERSAPFKSNDDLNPYSKRGFDLIGYSSFNSGSPENEAGAIEQGKVVGADLVVVFSPQYTGSTTSAVPITTPTTTTSNTSSTATAYGYGGTVNAYGNSTTTTYGSKTTYIPITTHRSDYGAAFFVKIKVRLGAFFIDLTDAQRKTLGTNQGVSIITIVDGSPAFLADLFVGDAITEFNGVKVANVQAMQQMLKEYSGRIVTFKIFRDGKYINKKIQLN